MTPPRIAWPTLGALVVESPAQPDARQDHAQARRRRKGSRTGNEMGIRHTTRWWARSKLQPASGCIVITVSYQKPLVADDKAFRLGEETESEVERVVPEFSTVEHFW
jgi:hypothetical protein